MFRARLFARMQIVIRVIIMLNGLILMVTIGILKTALFLSEHLQATAVQCRVLLLHLG